MAYATLVSLIDVIINYFTLWLFRNQSLHFQSSNSIFEKINNCKDNSNEDSEKIASGLILLTQGLCTKKLQEGNHNDNDFKSDQMIIWLLFCLLFFLITLYLSLRNFDKMIPISPVFGMILPNPKEENQTIRPTSQKQQPSIEEIECPNPASNHRSNVDVDVTMDIPIPIHLRCIIACEETLSQQDRHGLRFPQACKPEANCLTSDLVVNKLFINYRHNRSLDHLYPHFYPPEFFLLDTQHQVPMQLDQFNHLDTPLCHNFEVGVSISLTDFDSRVP